jgi:hypothetical protein
MAELMNHEAVQEWIDDAFVAPGMRDDDDATARGVRAHLATCAECGVYDEATRRAALKLDMARGPAPDVRARTLAAAHRLPRANGVAAATAAAVTAPPRRSGALTWRLAALVLGIAVLGAGAGAWWANAARQDSHHLADAVAQMSILASRSGAHEVVLRDAAGNGSGMAVMLPVSHELAVLATHLPAGTEYHCYIERAGERTWLGNMYVDGGVQFWEGAMDSSFDMQPGDVLVVAADDDAPAVLSATL